MWFSLNFILCFKSSDDNESVKWKLSPNHNIIKSKHTIVEGDNKTLFTIAMGTVFSITGITNLSNGNKNQMIYLTKQITTRSGPDGLLKTIENCEFDIGREILWILNIYILYIMKNIPKFVDIDTQNQIIIILTTTYAK